MPMLQASQIQTAAVLGAGTMGHGIAQGLAQCGIEVRPYDTAPGAVGGRMGKEPIVVKDSPGFASSRLGVLLGLEAIRMLESGVASAEDIDKALVLGYGHPMGPLRLSDLVGLDVRLSIADYLAKELGERFAAPALMREMVQRGELGKQSGRGIY